MQYNLDFEFTALIFVIFIFVYSCSFYPVNSKKNFLFRIMGIVLLITIAFDVVSAYFINHAVNISNVINIITNTSYFVFGTLLSYIFSIYTDMFIIAQNGKILLKKTKGFVLIVLEIALFVNCFTGLIFYFNENREYVHGPLYYIVYGGPFFFIITVLIELLVNFKKLNRAQRISGSLFFLVFVTPTILQMLVFSDVLLMLFGAALGYLVNFFFLETPDYAKLIVALAELNETQKKLEQNNIQLQREKERADHASKAKSLFLANMSHEIRTPINAVLGLDKIILRESKEPEIRKYAKDIQSSGKSLLSLVNDILDFSKIESGKMELVYGEYDITGIINDVVNMIRPKIVDKNLEFIIDVDENIPSKLYGDDIRIRQILINLLTNAVKYTHKGRVELIASAVCEADAAHLTFSVKDSGIGIKPEDISKLSQEFVRIEESRNKNIEGTGLGMNIVISLLQLMGSKIEIESVYGEGSNFYFTITQPIRDMRPIGNINERLMNIEEDEEHVLTFSIPDCRLLVVDDNAMNRNVFVNLLKGMQCPIDEAESGKQCLELVQKEKYDIIFMDHMMPEMDGVETFNRMKNMGDYLNADTPVIILTANAISGAKEEYLTEGFNDYLSKPIDADKLEAMIEHTIPEQKKKEIVRTVEEAAAPQKLEMDLPFIDGVDWENAMQKLKSEKLLQDSIKAFSTTAKLDIDTLKGMQEQIRKNPNEDNFGAYRIKVHSMKTNVATIGANHVAGLAKYLEYAARDLEGTTIENMMPLFEKEWNRLKSSIDEAIGIYDAKDDGAKEGISKEALAELLDILVPAVEEMDFDRVDAVMEEIMEHSYSLEQKELIDELKAAAMNMDGEACLDLRNDLIQKQ